MSQNSTSIGFLYNPDNQDDRELRDRFVIRTKEFGDIIRDLKRTASSTLGQQYIIEGQRGTGKTSMLLRIRSEVLSDDALSHLLPVRFAEEQYGIFSLSGLWEKVAEELEETEGFESLADTLDEQSEEADYELECFDTLEQYLIKNNKKLLLLMDNFGDILDKFSLTEQQRLRDVFHNSAYIQLVAASAKTLEHTYKHDSPFFEFFKVVHLAGLDKEDTYTLLRKLAEVHGVEEQINHILEHQQHRVESIRRLTGGVPRTIVLLYEIFIDESGSVFEDLENILDRVTPLYKHRMDDLSTQQQVIVNALALNWDGMSTKELTDKIKDKNFASKKISAQLQQLQNNDLVIAEAIDKKNKIYFLQERFFNIWYLMRYGRKKNKQNVRWLVSFLEEWCDTEELHKRARLYIDSAKRGKLSPKSYLMAESMSCLIYDESLQHELVISTREALKGKVNEIELCLSPSDREVMVQAEGLFCEKRINRAIKTLEPLAKKGITRAILNLAFYFKELGSENYEEAIYYYKLSIEEGSAQGMNDLGCLYSNEIEDFDQAIHFFKMAAKKGLSIAMNNLGSINRCIFNDYDQAEFYYKMSADKGDSSAMHILGHLYSEELNDREKSIFYHKKAIENGNDDGLNCLAWKFYQEVENPMASLGLIEKAYSQEKSPEITHTLATVMLWNNQLGKSIEKAKEYLSFSDGYLGFLEDVGDYFILLLAKGQAEAAYQLFKDTPNLEQQIKPIYYATLTLLKDEYPKEYLKMGSELKETVDEILEKVKEKAEKYC